MNWERVIDMVTDATVYILRERLDVARSEPPPRAVSEPVCCARCGAEPWTIRWGSIRIAQQLDGFYSQAVAGKDPLLLCRDCFHVSVGIADPDLPL